MSKKQTKKAICKCGCGEIFYPVRFSPNIEFPEYIRGHHPKCRTTQFGSFPSWNKGLTKDDHPSISKMGYQQGHKSFFSWKDVHKLMKDNPEIKQKWLNSKKGQVAWNKGLTKSQYKNGIKSGPDHGNWCGGNRWFHDSAQRKEFALQILERDNYTCQKCGDRNHNGRGSRIKLEVHHVVAISENYDLAFDPLNAITLCATCHRKTENFGTKLIHKRRKQVGN